MNGDLSLCEPRPVQCSESTPNNSPFNVAVQFYKRNPLKSRATIQRYQRITQKLVIINYQGSCHGLPSAMTSRCTTVSMSKFLFRLYLRVILLCYLGEDQFLLEIFRAMRSEHRVYILREPKKFECEGQGGLEKAAAFIASASIHNSLPIRGYMLFSWHRHVVQAISAGIVPLHVCGL